MGKLDLTTRVYNFTLPYKISGVEIHFGLSQLKESGIFDRLPHSIRTMIEHASDNYEDISITKEMCDSVDDDTWQLLAQKLNLDWNLE